MRLKSQRVSFKSSLPPGEAAEKLLQAIAPPDAGVAGTVETGRVKLYRTSWDGKRARVCFFGEFSPENGGSAISGHFARPVIYRVFFVSVAGFIVLTFVERLADFVFKGGKFELNPLTLFLMAILLAVNWGYLASAGNVKAAREISDFIRGKIQTP